jgi:hypothetical protein
MGKFRPSFSPLFVDKGMYVLNVQELRSRITYNAKTIKLTPPQIAYVCSRHVFILFFDFEYSSQPLIQ